jgi:hypothetical protein
MDLHDSTPGLTQYSAQAFWLNLTTVERQNALGRQFPKRFKMLQTNKLSYHSGFRFVNGFHG